MTTDEQILQALQGTSTTPSLDSSSDTALPMGPSPVFTDAATKRREDIVSRAALGHYGEEEQTQANILKALPKTVDQMRRQGFTDQAILDFQKKSQAFLDIRKKKSTYERVYGQTESGEPIKGVTIDIGKNIYEGLTQEWLSNRKGQTIPADVEKSIRVASEGIAERIKDDPAQAAILRDLYMGFKAVPDALMLGASTVYNAGTLVRYAADTADELFASATGRKVKYKRTGKEVLRSIIASYNSIHDGILTDSLSNDRVTKHIFREKYGVELDSTTVRRLTDLNRETASGWSRVGQFTAGSVGPNVAITAIAKTLGRTANRQMKKYYVDWAKQNKITKSMDKLDEGEYARFAEDFVQNTRGIGYRFAGETNFSPIPLIRDAARVLQPFIAKPVSRLAVRQGLYQQQAKRTKEVARRLEAKEGKIPSVKVKGVELLQRGNIVTRMRLVREQDKRIRNLTKKQNNAYAKGNFEESRLLSARIGREEAYRTGYALGVITPGTKNMILSEVGALAGFEIARETGNENLQFLFVLGGAMTGPLAFTKGVKTLREQFGATFVLPLTTKIGYLDNLIKDRAALERFVVGRDLARFYTTRTITEGDRKGQQVRQLATRAERRLLKDIAKAADSVGIGNQIAVRMANLGELKKQLNELGVTDDQFKTTIDALTGLTPLIALTEINKGSTTLTNSVGRIKLDVLEDAISASRVELDQLISTMRLLDSLLPEGADPNLLPEAVQAFQTAAFSLVTKRVKDITEMQANITRDIADIEASGRDLPSLWARAGNNKSLMDEISGIEEELFELIAKLDPRYLTRSGGNMELFPHLGPARQELDEVTKLAGTARAMAGDIWEDSPVVKHGHHAARSDEPFDNFVQLATDFLDGIHRTFTTRFNLFFDEVKEVKAQDMQLVHKVMQLVYKEPTPDAGPKRFAKEGIDLGDVKRVKSLIDDEIKKLLEQYFNAQKQGKDAAEIAAIDEAFEEFMKDANKAGYYAAYTALKGMDDTVPELQISVRNLHRIARGVQRQKRFADEAQKSEYADLHKAIEDDIENALNAFDAQRGATEGTTAEKFKVLREDYLNDYIARQDSKIGKLLFSGRQVSKKDDPIVRNYDANTWSNYLDMSGVIRDAGTAQTKFDELTEFFGEFVERESGRAKGLKYELNPETKFLMATKSGKPKNPDSPGAQARSTNTEMLVGDRLRGILTELVSRAYDDLPQMKRIRVEAPQVGDDVSSVVGKTQDETLINVQDAAIKSVFGDMIDENVDSVATSLSTLIRTNAEAAKKFGQVSRHFEDVQRELTIEAENARELTRRAMDLSLTGQVAKINTVPDFVDAILTPGRMDVNDTRKVLDEIITVMKQAPDSKVKDEDIMEIVRTMVAKRIKERAFSGTPVTGPEGQPLKAFDHEAFGDALNQSKDNLRQLFPDPPKGEISTIDKAIRVSEIMSVINTRAEAPAGFGTYDVRGFSPSSVISRLYAVNRQVVSARYVFTEMSFMLYRKKQADEMVAMLRDPAMADLFFNVLVTRQPIPSNEMRGMATLRVLARAAAFENVDRETGPGGVYGYKDTILPSFME